MRRPCKRHTDISRECEIGHCSIAHAHKWSTDRRHNVGDCIKGHIHVVRQLSPNLRGSWIRPRLMKVQRTHIVVRHTGLALKEEEEEKEGGSPVQ